MKALKEVVPDSVASKAVHIVLQGKGGVGKSFVAALLAQYLQGVRGGVKCIDTDPVNQTLANYKALDAQHIKLMDGSKIDERNFDHLMERLLSEDGTFVIDNGASSFIPLSSYLVENNAFEMLNDAGLSVVIHCVVTGNQALTDTLSGFRSLAEMAGNRQIVVWLNEYFGSIERDGKSFTDMRVYVENQAKVFGVMRIPKRNQDTFGKDVELMCSQRLTFAEVLEGPEFSIMAKQRIKTVQRDIFSQLEQIGF